MACTDFLIKISHLNRKTKQRSKDFKHEDRDYSEHGIFQSQLLMNSKTDQIASKVKYIDIDYCMHGFFHHKMPFKQQN